MQRQIYGGSRAYILCRIGSATGNDTVRARIVEIVASELDLGAEFCDGIKNETIACGRFASEAAVKETSR